MMTIVDYGLGNIYALVNVYRRLNISVSIAKCSQDLLTATKLILPGVGAFDYAMQALDASGMRETLTNQVLQENVPILGICVGMQVLAHSSSEGQLVGLGWIEGSIQKMRTSTTASNIVLPHMGWNDVVPCRENPLFAGLEQSARFYFLHSYYFDCDHTETSLAESDYGQRFTCAVNRKQIYGVQFHPEKSHHYGSRLLKNFADL